MDTAKIVKTIKMSKMNKKLKLTVSLIGAILALVSQIAYTATINLTSSTINTGIVSGTNGADGINASSGAAATNGSDGTDGYYVDIGSSIPTLTNSGTINGGRGGNGGHGFAVGVQPNGGNGGNSGSGIYNKGTISTLVNTGNINAFSGGNGGLAAGGGTPGTDGRQGAAILNYGLIDEFTNRGSMTGDVSVSCLVSDLCDSVDNKNRGRINTLNNFGVINGDVFLGMDAPTPGATPSIGTLNNSGSINRIYLQYMVGEGVAIETVNNSGQINDGIHIVGIMSSVELGIGTLINSGSIDGGIQIQGVGSLGGLSGAGIKSFFNTGTLTGGITINGVQYYGVQQSGIESLTNMGSIADGISISSISNGSTGIDTLNNLQGDRTTSALTYTGKLPNNYNIIINAAGQYGQLSGTSVTSSTTFGIYAGSNITNRLYTGVLQGIASSNLTGVGTTTRTGTFDGMAWTLTETVTIAGSENWNLSFTGVSVAQTQSSVHALASKLRGAFSSQAVATNYANMNTYDCNLFDAKGLCISVGGQQSYVDSPSSNFTSTVVVAGYRVSPTFRVGGFLNQNLNNSTSRNVDISNANPLMGLFAVWNQNEDHLGYQVKVANAYQDKDVTTIRDAVETSEAGRGNTELNTQSYVGELSYAFLANEDKTLIRPYAAVRYTRIKQDAYTEEATSAVTAPLSYKSLIDRSTSALGGVKVDHKLAEKLNLKASLGIEQDLYHHVDNLTATGVSGLTSESFNDNIKRTRPVASIGAYYMPAKNQRISADLYYQQLPFQSTASTTAYLNYMIGF